MKLSREHATGKELADGIVVIRIDDPSKPMVEYLAYEPLIDHTGRMEIDGKPYGLIGTRPYPPELLVKPTGRASHDPAIVAWHKNLTGWMQDQYSRARDAILEAYPRLEKTALGRGIVGIYTEVRPSDSRVSPQAVSQQKERPKKAHCPICQGFVGTVATGRTKTAKKMQKTYYCTQCKRAVEPDWR